MADDDDYYNPTRWPAPRRSMSPDELRRQYPMYPDPRPPKTATEIAMRMKELKMACQSGIITDEMLSKLYEKLKDSYMHSIGGPMGGGMSSVMTGLAPPPPELRESIVVHTLQDLERTLNNEVMRLGRALTLNEMMEITIGRFAMALQSVSQPGMEQFNSFEFYAKVKQRPA